MNTCIASRLCTVARIGAPWTASAASTLGAPPQEGFSEAARHYQTMRWSEAYGHFSRLANRGEADAARVALFMHQHGPQLYGSDWHASDEEVQAWTQLSAQARGRPSIDYQLED